MIRRTLIFFIVLALCIELFSFTDKEKKENHRQKVIRTIIIDAGHGIMDNGQHNGAKGSYSFEDDICYDISKLLVEKVRQEFPEIKIVESRPTRKITPIHRRAEIANENKGELFVCIHVNAANPIRHSEIRGYKKVTYYEGRGKKRRKKTKEVPVYRYWTTPNPAKGAETYIWGAGKNDDKEVAIRENAPMLQEENFKKNYGDIDPNSPEFNALSLLKVKQFFKRSTTLAGFVQDEFARIGRIDGDVRQRQVGIWVLQATAMPSILVETGYISNRVEEDYLNSKVGQNETADCILKALKKYISWLESQQSGTDKIIDSVDLNNNNNATKELTTMLQKIDDKERKHK